MKETFESESERERRREAIIAEAARPTGFDVLMAEKKKNMTRLRKLLKEDPSLSRSEIAGKLGLSMRTVYRYLGEIRKHDPNATTEVDAAVLAKRRRIERLRVLLKKDPTTSVTFLASLLGVSRRTLYSYLDEIGN